MLMLRAVGSWLFLVLSALILVEGARRIGTSLLPLLSSRRFCSMERLGIGLLLGWLTLSAALLGLALTGLFSPLPISAAALSMLALGGSLRIGDPLLKGALREMQTIGMGGLALFAAALAAGFYRLFTPEVDGTSFLYHLAVPWNFLQSHRALIEHTYWAFHLPLPIDINYALGLMLEGDRAAKWQATSYLLAAGAFFAGYCLRRRQPTASWLGPLLAMSIFHVSDLLWSTKNDISASAFFVVGALLTRDRAWTLGSLFLGLSVAAKFAYGPMALVWLAATRPPRARVLWCGLLFSMPIAIWCAKSQLAMGNPLHPWTGLLFDAYDWGQLNERTIKGVLSGIWHSEPVIKTLPLRFFKDISNDYPLILLLAPGLMFFGSRRLPILICMLAMLITFAICPMARYLLPCAWLILLFAVREIDALPSHLRIRVRVFTVLYSLVAVFIQSGSLDRDYGDVLLSQNAFRAKERAVHHEAIAMIKGAPLRRILLVGDWRTYLLPARPLFNGWEGETPPIWKAARESGDVAAFAKKIRQLGASHLLYNYVTAILAGLSYEPFPWDRRMALLYLNYCRSHLRILKQSTQADFKGGGYYLYEIVDKPLSRPPESVWFAPGMETFYGEGVRLMEMGKPAEALPLLKDMLETTPNVGQIWNEAGRSYFMLHDYPNALKYLSKYYAEGMVDYYNRVIYAAALAKTGKLDEAEAILLANERLYSHQAGFIYWNLAEIQMEKAYLAGERGRFIQAQAFADRGLEHLRKIPENDPAYPKVPTIRASLIATIGQSYLSRGDPTTASCLFNLACEICPTSPNVQLWREIIRKLPPCPGGYPLKWR